MNEKVYIKKKKIIYIHKYTYTYICTYYTVFVNYLFPKMCIIIFYLMSFQKLWRQCHCSYKTITITKPN